MELKEFFQAYALSKLLSSLIYRKSQAALKMSIWRGMVMYTALSVRGSPPAWGLMTWR